MGPVMPMTTDVRAGRLWPTLIARPKHSRNVASARQSERLFKGLMPSSFQSKIARRNTLPPACRVSTTCANSQHND